MKKTKKPILLILALCTFLIAHTQQKAIIRGRVIDKTDKSAIIGANVIEYDKDNRVVNGSICDINGDFILQIQDLTNIVRISFVGYNTIEVKIDPTKTITVELEPSVNVMEEVVVTAMAKTSRRTLTNIDDRDKASSSVRMDLKDMKESGALSVADALQGKVSGLDILSASGDPGSGFRIIIRGLSSIGNSKPLIVVDGIEQANPPDYSSFNLSSATAEDLGNLINISVQDIKSVEILKDAAATSQYGSKGSQGVLLIETHKGRKGKVGVSYTFKRNLEVQPPAIPMLNGDEYITLQQEAWHNQLGILTWPEEINPTSSNAYIRNNYNKNTNWISAITQKGYTNDHFLNVQGGGEKATYYTSLSYTDNVGTTINTRARTFSTRLNIEYELSKKILFNLSFSYTHFLNDGNIVIKDENNNDRGVREMAYIKSPNMSIWEYDENGVPTGEYFTPKESYQSNDPYRYFNPVAVAELGSNDLRRNSLVNSFSVKYILTNWLTFYQTASIEIQGEKGNNFLPYNAIGTDWLEWTVNIAGESNRIYQNFGTQSQLLYNLPLPNDKHKVYGALTWKTEQSRTENMEIQSNRTPSVDIQDPSVNAQINWMGSWLSETRFLESVISLNYKYADKYMVQTTFTRDAHNAFGENNRWGSFYGISGAWRFSEEPFLKDLPFMSESKLRLSHGLSGKQPSDAYARFTRYDAVTGYMGYSAVVPGRPQLDNLQWETTASTNLGLDLNLFKDRFTIIFESYYKTSSNILFSYYNIPYSSGYDYLRFLNGGKLENKGWEIMSDFKIVNKADLMISLKFNISQNLNKFVEIPDNFNKEKDTDVGDAKYPRVIAEGEPLGSFYGFRYLGVYATDADAIAKDANGISILDIKGDPIPMTYKGTEVFRGGDAKYEDVNHDGRIDINDVVYIGNSSPKYYGGFGTDIKYKNLTFNCHFQFRVGNKIMNMTAAQTQGMNNRNNSSKAVLRRWRAQGMNEPDILPRAMMGSYINNLGSDRYIENGDFLRLINIQAGYRFSNKVCEKLNLKNMSVTLSARKIATFTRYTGQDPEVSPDASDPFWMGADNSKTPPPRIMTIAFTLGF